MNRSSHVTCPLFSPTAESRACPRPSQRLDIALPPADIDALRVVAAITGETTLTAVVRDALKVYVWLVTEQQRHCLIVSEDPTHGDRIQLMPLLRVTELPAAT